MVKDCNSLSNPFPCSDLETGASFFQKVELRGDNIFADGFLIGRKAELKGGNKITYIQVSDNKKLDGQIMEMYFFNEAIKGLAE